MQKYFLIFIIYFSSLSFSQEVIYTDRYYNYEEKNSSKKVEKNLSQERRIKEEKRIRDLILQERLGIKDRSVDLLSVAERKAFFKKRMQKQANTRIGVQNVYDYVIALEGKPYKSSENILQYSVLNEAHNKALISQVLPIDDIIDYSYLGEISTKSNKDYCYFIIKLASNNVKSLLDNKKLFDYLDISLFDSYLLQVNSETGELIMNSHGIFPTEKEQAKIYYDDLIQIFKTKEMERVIVFIPSIENKYRIADMESDAAKQDAKDFLTKLPDNSYEIIKLSVMPIIKANKTAVQLLYQDKKVESIMSIGTYGGAYGNPFDLSDPNVEIELE